MKSTTKLPEIEAFYSNLNEETITREEHEFAQAVWEEFDCKNLLDYCNIYCRCDNILCGESFQKFRHTMHEFTGLDPAYYISLPSFAWDSMLKLTKTTLECFSDIDMCHFVESGIRGGLSFIGHRHYKTSPEKKIFYIDANVSQNYAMI